MLAFASMTMNPVKRKLKDGGTVLVLNPNFPSPALYEHAATLGFDVAFIDCEHGSAGFERVEELARAARAGGITSILRPWSGEPGLVTRFLDCGVGGIQFPHIENAAAARSAIEIVRAARGSDADATLVAAMIESRTAVENISEVVAVEGLDAVVIGLNDLVQSLGHAGNRKHADVQRAVDTVIAAARDSGRVAAGYNLHHWEEARGLMDKGVRWFTIHAKGMLARGSRELNGLLGFPSP
jgi:2-keto-3-deoxy-L-rhamnonate aldolase RhmA